MDPTASRLAEALLYGLVPLWMLAGFADYGCHRVQRIEHSSGVVESGLHLLMLAELGIGLAAALLFAVDAAVLALLLAACLAHEATLWADLAYAARKRRIPLPEQWVHGLQQAIPWIGFAALVLLHPEQARALFGMGGEAPDWSWRAKAVPLPWTYLGGLAALGTVLVLLPFLGEYRRCRAAALKR